MLQEFSTWYLEVNPEPTSELLESRWNGVEGIAGATKTSQISDLVLIAFGLESANDDYVKSFGVAFQEHDKAFKTSNNVIEYSVLSSAVLAQLMEKTSSTALCAALSTTCVGVLGKRTNDVSPWLVDRAETYLRDCSAQLRRREQGIDTPATYKLFEVKELEELRSANNWSECVNQLFQNINAALSTINKTSSTTSQALRALEHRQLLLEEESDILWWVIGNRSRFLDKPFSAIDGRNLALIAGRELAEFNRVPPGPVAVAALLNAAIDKASEPTSRFAVLQTVINKTEKKWRETVIDEFADNCNSALYPIHTALAKATESTKWGEAFEHVVGLPVTTKMSLCDFGLLFYRECLLHRIAAA